MKPALSYDALRQVVIEQQDEIARLRIQPLVEREQTKTLLEVLHKSWIKVIIGIRRSGKSVMAHQALRNQTYGYVNFDDERFIGLSSSDLNKILQFLIELNPSVKIFFFDEIQNVDGWELFVNRLQRQGYNLIITGSNSKLLSKELATHLTGRYIAIELTPFSFREFLAAKQFQYTQLSLEKTTERALLYSFLNEYLNHGGFPEIVIGGYFAPYLQELYNTIIARDIVYRYHVKYSNTLKELAIYSHANLGNRLTLLKLKNTFQVSSIHTVKNYTQYLVDAYIVLLLKLFSHKYKEQIRQPKKVYTIDNGLSAAISSKFSQDRGNALENLVFQELYRQGHTLHYYATADAEVDFVVSKNRKAISLIQVAFTLHDETTRHREIKALIKAAKQLHCSDLTIITWEEEQQLIVERMKVAILPIWKWLLFP